MEEEGGCTYLLMQRFKKEQPVTEQRGERVKGQRKGVRKRKNRTFERHSEHTNHREKDNEREGESVITQSNMP